MTLLTMRTRLLGLSVTEANKNNKRKKKTKTNRQLTLRIIRDQPAGRQGLILGYQRRRLPLIA